MVRFRHTCWITTESLFLPVGHRRGLKATVLPGMRVGQRTWVTRPREIGALGSFTGGAFEPLTRTLPSRVEARVAVTFLMEIRAQCVLRLGVSTCVAMATC